MTAWVLLTVWLTIYGRAKLAKEKEYGSELTANGHGSCGVRIVGRSGNRLPRMLFSRMWLGM